MTDQQTTLEQSPFDVAAQIEGALRTIDDMKADVEFTLSPIGILRREDREIAYAAEIVALREQIAEMESEITTWRKADPDPSPLSTSKPTNPKDGIGANKLPLHLWPSTATAMGCVGLANGALKYGRSNFRCIGIRASIYVDAAKRHIDAWFEGEECDPDDGVPHMAAALACLAIIVDAQAAGKMNDDRAVAGGYRALVDSLTPHVARLKALHAGKDPKHYTIADNQP